MTEIKQKKPATLNESEQGLRNVQVPLNKIKTNPQQPRKTFYSKSIDELAQSIEWHGLLQPISVQRDDDNFIIVAGERRVLAYKKLGRDRIEAIIVDGNPRELALIENIQREDLHPLDLAGALLRLQQDHNYTDSQIADIIGKSRTTVNELLRINSLPISIQEECRTSDTVTKSVLLQVARGKDDRQKLALWDVVKKIGSTRDVKTQRNITKDRKDDADRTNRQFVIAVRRLFPKIELISYREIISEKDDYETFVRLRNTLNSAIVAYEEKEK